MTYCSLADKRLSAPSSALQGQACRRKTQERRYKSASSRIAAVVLYN